MLIEHSLERIVVVPRNGYVNRLQAWASGAILGAELDVPVSVLWEAQPVAPASAGDLFSPRLLHTMFVDAQWFVARVGLNHEALPRHLTIDHDRRIVVLAGHELGEQVFMGDLPEALADESRPETLVIIAGGQFHLPEADHFDRQRRMFYSSLEWNTAIAERVDAALGSHPLFAGLHVRGTDRSREAPTHSAMRAALVRLQERTGLVSLFIAADSAQARDRWSKHASDLGFTPWSSGDIAYDRSNPASGVDAIIDWILLGHAQAIAYSATSSFGAEAALSTARPDLCLPLSASPARQRVRDGLRVAESALTYPRRTWFGR